MIRLIQQSFSKVRADFLLTADIFLSVMTFHFKIMVIEIGYHGHAVYYTKAKRLTSFNRKCKWVNLM